MRTEQTPVPVRNRLEVLEVLRRSRSIEEAAKAIGFTVTELRDYCNAHHMGSAFYRLAPSRPRPQHPSFRDMTGRQLAGGAVVVETRGTNDPHGNARWWVRFVACGHRVLREAIKLRADEKRGHVPNCPTCREVRRARLVRSAEP